jgi:hypothetical protein
MPEHLKKAGETYTTFLENQRSTNDDYQAGQQNQNMARADILNHQTLLQARTIFRQGMENDGAGDVVVNAISCNESQETGNAYNCEMTRAEIGGVDACTRVKQEFMATIDQDGDLLNIVTTRSGHVTKFEIDSEEYIKSDDNIIPKGLVTHILGDFGYGAQRYPEIRNTVLKFSGCLAKRRPK